MRGSGVLLPISSLPSEYGIGALDRQAYMFIDILKEAGQKYWQILPVGPTSYGDSPYQSFSTFAGNPFFISLEKLIEQGYLTKEECMAVDFDGHPCYIEYEKIYYAYADSGDVRRHGRADRLRPNEPGSLGPVENLAGPGPAEKRADHRFCGSGHHGH